MEKSKIYKKETEDRYIVPAVEQAMLILQRLSQAKVSRMSLTEICHEVGIHKSQAYAILHTLQKYGMVKRNLEKKGYLLGPGTIALSRKFLDDLNVPQLAKPIIKGLAAETSGTAVLGLIDGEHVFVAAKYESENDIGIVTMRIGQRFPLTLGSHGKVIAAHLPEKAVDRLLRHPKLYFHGKPEKFDGKRFEDEILECRRQGFAEDMGEIMEGINNIAAPVLGANLTPIGYILLLSSNHAETLRRFGPLVSEGAKILSRQLGAKLD